MWEELLLSKAMFRQNLLPFLFLPLLRNGGMEREERRGAGEVREIEDLLHTPHLLPANLLKNWGGTRRKTREAETVFSRKRKRKWGSRRVDLEPAYWDKGIAMQYTRTWGIYGERSTLPDLCYHKCICYTYAAYLKLQYNKSCFWLTERALGKQGCVTILLSIKPGSLRISGRISNEF